MTDYRVTPLTLAKLSEIAVSVLKNAPLNSSGGLDVIQALRASQIFTVDGPKSLRFRELPDSQLPEDLAHVWSAGDRVAITIREGVMRNAYRGDREALGVLRHEYAHGVLHSGEMRSKVALARKALGNETRRFIKDDESVETQANRLGAFFGAPPALIDIRMSEAEVSMIFDVSLREAACTIGYVRAKASKNLPDDISRVVAEIKAASLNTPARPEDVLWNKLEIPDGYPSDEFRLCGGFLIQKSHFMSTTQTGWMVEQGRIIPLAKRLQI